jgi:Tfp pilus assembly protein PilF
MPSVIPAVAPLPPLPVQGSVSANWARRESLIALGLVAAVLLVYSFLLRCDFVNYDDEHYVTHNPYLQLGLSWNGLVWGLTTVYFSNWHPLVWWSFLLDHQVYGLNPAGYHATNLLWHLGSTLILFAALRRMTRCVWPSALVAALFAVHPLNVQSVAWISERKGVISTFFWMLTLWNYARYVERPALGRYSLVALSMALGLMAKQMLVTLPFILLLLDYWPLGRFRERHNSLVRLVVEKLPLVALAAGAGALTVIAQAKYGSVTNLVILSLSARVKNALVSFLVYIYQAILPLNLAAFYAHQGDTLPLWQPIAATVILAGITVLVLNEARRFPYLAVGWLWYVVTLLPVIGVVQVGYQAHADRYAYVPLVGLFIAAAWGLADLARARAAIRPAGALAGLVLASFMIGSWLQVHYWQSSIALWENAVAATGGNAVAHNSLAVEYLQSHQKDKALEEFEKAVQFDFSNQQAHVNLGMLYMERLDLPRATRHFQEALRYRDDNALAQMAHLNLGVLLLDSNLDEAGRHFDAALQINPRFARAHGDMAFYLARRGDRKGAAAHYEKALEIDPNDATIYLKRGSGLLEERQLEAAGADFDRAVSLSPRIAALHLGNLAPSYLTRKDSAAAQICLRALRGAAWSLATDSDDRRRDGNLALRLAEQVHAGLGDEPDVLDTLAAAQAEVGAFQPAVATARRAQRLAVERGQGDLATAIGGRLQGYEQNRAYRSR